MTIFKKTMAKAASVVLGVSMLGLLVSCANQPKRLTNFDDVCEIFKAKPRWYKAAKKSTEKRGGNIQLPMAIIYQESTFQHDARPARKRLLGFLPGKRPSNAYGYAQALEGTWGEYEESVGSRRKRRDNFADAFDFVQWYVDKSYQRNKVSKWDYHAHYLNYHEGHGGYARGTYASKSWLTNTAQRVEQRARQYGAQLQKCKSELESLKTGWF
ncbi:MAG: hypothetical protein MK188_10720 [Gammaproteobacteria bacterium]|nr:hypothetical protein [Gammaproteobacteria bacterium]